VTAVLNPAPPGALRAGSRALLTLNPSTLRDLAAAIEWRSPAAVARRRLTPEGIERLAEILLAGERPAIGLFRRYKKDAQ
jgi:hypothetical protein